MHPVSPALVVESLSWRYAVKKFDHSKKIPAATWSALEHAALLSPSSYGLQPYKFLVVTNAQVRAKLLPASWNQSQITDASHLVAFCRKLETSPEDVQTYIDRIAQVRGLSASSLDGFKNMMLGSISKAPLKDQLSEWAAKQVYIALGVFLTSCAMMGIDACPMEGFEAPKYDDILGLTGTGYSTTVLATAGYRAVDDHSAAYKKVRKSPDKAIFHI